jgi:hypothetical protein
MSAGLRRKDHFDEKLGALNPNISLPDNIATQLLDSPYFTRLLGNDLAEAHSIVEEKKDDARVVERHAAENNVPLQELRALVESMRPAPDLRPFEGQAAHEARAAQLNIGAQLEQQRVGLARFHIEQQTVQEAQSALQQQHGQTLAGLAAQLATTQRRYKRNFVARPESSSASEPGAEPGAERRGRSRR